jgi:tetratricopeptide (TPR) repeat protein
MKIKREIFCFAACITLLLAASCSNRSRIADAYFRKGRSFAESNRPDSALAQYRLAIQVDPEHMKANMAYQDLAVEKFGKDDEVWDAYETLAKAHPRNQACQILFTRLWTNSDAKIDQALRIAERHPRTFWAQALLGSAYEGYSNRDYTPEAISAYEKAERIDPSEIDMKIKLASLYRRVDDYKNAKKALQKALELDSTRADLLPLLWRNEYLLAADKDSITKVLNGKIDQNLARYGKNVAFLNSLMSLYSRMDDKARLEETAKQIAALDPRGQQAENEAMDRIWNENDPEKGRREAEAYLDSFPESRYARSAFGMWLTFSKMQPGFSDAKAEAYAQSLLRKNPRSTWIFESLYYHYHGDLPDQAGKQEQNVQSWLGAVSGREKPRVMNMLAGLYMKQNRTDDALRLLLKADSLCLKYRNPSADVAASIGDVYQKKGDTDSALDYYSRAVVLGGGDAVLEKCTAAYEKKFGSREGARKYVNRKILTEAAVKNPYPAPGFVLASLSGDTVRMSDFKGKVVLAAVWNPG